MSREATVNCGLLIRKGSLAYQSTPSAFTADVAGTKGPSPGAITVTTAGTDVDLSQLSQPGLCWLQNLEPPGGNFVEYGVRDPATSGFYPLGELLPGEGFVLRLSRNLEEEYYPSTGTGTTGPTKRLHLKANGASVDVRCDAFQA